MSDDKNLILIVEDTEKNVRLIRDVLEASGYNTIHAGDGKIGTELAKEKKPCLIIMDIQMPVMDGLQAATIIKNDADTKDIPIIALTSYAMKGDKDRMLKVGFDEYISKPFKVTELLNTVSKFFSKYQ